MQASVFTSEMSRRWRHGLLLFLACLALPLVSRAENGPPPPPPGPGGSSSGSTPAEPRASQPEDQDLRGTPYTEYGEFNEQTIEDEFTRFLQYGRFVGVSIGAGYAGATGNRGLRYQGGFPSYELKLNYWFSFDFALEMGVSSSNFFLPLNNNESRDINILRVGLDLKYYIPVQNLSAPLTFANPFFTLGFGNLRKSEKIEAEEAVNVDSTVALDFGAGLEFTLNPRRTYFYLSGKYHLSRFADSSTTKFQASDGIDDLSGHLFDFTMGFLFTW
ncbi:MAG: outer membrane beta-barrel protein [Bdellovibrionales bacterium]|nr:outer membrane beta-barrel protein [Bdellovibrionales bacterium]